MDARDTKPIPSSFSPFRDLPKEIQDQIWEYAIDMIGDRVVEIKADSSMTSTCPIPALLHVSQDSRRHSLQRWKLSIGKEFSQRKIFFDNSRDVLCFGSDFPDITWFGKEMYPASGDGVRNIAFNMDEQREAIRRCELSDAGRLRKMFPDLTTVFLLSRNLDLEYEAVARGDDQPALNPQERLIAFEPLRPQPRGSRPRLGRAFAHGVMECPAMLYVNYYYVPRQ